jgi:pSer/pThr/pTyr-binding forkhead associated (FHA) protein
MHYHDDPPTSPQPHFRPTLPTVHLEIRRGRARDTYRAIQVPVYLMGSAPDSDLVLGDTQFPEAHAYIFVQSQGVMLRRLGSGPEISVEGHVVQSIQLRDGDRIRTGPYEFLIHIENPGGGIRRTEKPDDAWAISPVSESWNEPGVDAVHQILREVREMPQQGPMPHRAG